MMPGARISPAGGSVVLAFLLGLALAACSTTEFASEYTTAPEPVQLRDINEWEYFNPYADNSDTTGYTGPRPGAVLGFDVPYSRETSRIRGELRLMLFVDEYGVIQKVKVDQPLHPKLDDPVQKAFLGKVFHAGMRNGIRIKSRVLLPIHFRGVNNRSSFNRY